MTTDTLALLLTFLIISISGISGISALILFLSRDTVKIPELLNKIINLEQVTQDISSIIQGDVNSSPQIMYESADGKYQGHSLEELIVAMTQDPNTPLTEIEIKSIKSVFDKISGRLMNNTDEDDGNGWKDSK